MEVVYQAIAAFLVQTLIEGYNGDKSGGEYWEQSCDREVESNIKILYTLSPPLSRA